MRIHPRFLLALAVLLALLFGPPAAHAQTTPPPDVQNPSAVEFEPSIDHAVIDGYELDILRPDGTVLQTLNLGKPPVVNNLCTAPINVQPVAFEYGYSMRARAKAGAVVSPDVPSLNKFDRVPGGPSKLIGK